MLWIWPEYIGARCRLARIRSWTAGIGVGDVAVELRLRRRARSGTRTATGSASPGCGSSRAKSIVRPLSRGGVPVLNRRSSKPSDAQALRQPVRGHVAAAAAGRLDLAGVHERLEERAGRQDDGPGPVSSAAPATHAGDAALLDQDRLDHLLAERQVLPAASTVSLARNW